jgi:hypothetical protein
LRQPLWALLVVSAETMRARSLVERRNQQLERRWAVSPLMRPRWGLSRELGSRAELSASVLEPPVLRAHRLCNQGENIARQERVSCVSSAPTTPPRSG